MHIHIHIHIHPCIYAYTCTCRPKRKEGEWSETIQTNWSRDGLRLKSDNLRRCCRLSGKIEAQCKDRVRADGVTSLIVAAGERCGSLGVGSVLT